MEFGGMKSLYSSVYFDEAAFEEMYCGVRYR